MVPFGIFILRLTEASPAYSLRDVFLNLNELLSGCVKFCRSFTVKDDAKVQLLSHLLNMHIL